MWLRGEARRAGEGEFNVLWRDTLTRRTGRGTQGLQSGRGLRQSEVKSATGSRSCQTVEPCKSGELVDKQSALLQQDPSGNLGAAN